MVNYLLVTLDHSDGPSSNNHLDSRGNKWCSIFNDKNGSVSEIENEPSKCEMIFVSSSSSFHEMWAVGLCGMILLFLVHRLLSICICSDRFLFVRFDFHYLFGSISIRSDSLQIDPIHYNRSDPLKIDPKNYKSIRKVQIDPKNYKSIRFTTIRPNHYKSIR